MASLRYERRAAARKAVAAANKAEIRKTKSARKRRKLERRMIRFSLKLFAVAVLVLWATLFIA